jgi:hypothetical protein
MDVEFGLHRKTRTERGMKMFERWVLTIFGPNKLRYQEAG